MLCFLVTSLKGDSFARNIFQAYVSLICPVSTLFTSHKHLVIAYVRRRCHRRSCHFQGLPDDGPTNRRQQSWRQLHAVPSSLIAHDICNTTRCLCFAMQLRSKWDMEPQTSAYKEEVTEHTCPHPACCKPTGLRPPKYARLKVPRNVPEREEESSAQ